MKYILVTGVSRGIGHQLVVDLVGRGHYIYGTTRDIENLGPLQGAIQGLSGKFVPIEFDAMKDDASTLLDKVELDHLDVLINNAGYLINRPFPEIAPEEFDHIYVVNVKAPFMMIQGLLPLLMNASQAHVVNIGSMGGVNGTAKFPGLSAYSSSKGALSILTECLAEEFKETSVRFNCLALGSANTEMLAQAFPGYEAPLSAKDMANYIADFSLEQWAFYNGKTLPVSSTTP